MQSIIPLITIVITFIAAWATNIGWLISNGMGDWGGQVVVSLLGIFFFPVGIFHGFYLWF